MILSVTKTKAAGVTEARCACWSNQAEAVEVKESE